MFAYCNNNPINYVDPSGHLARFHYLMDYEGIGNFRDVTEEINDVLYPEAQASTMQRFVVNHLFGPARLGGECSIYMDFYNKVNHKAAWDIKRQTPWENTIGTTFPGKNIPVIYEGSVMTPESLGNYTYGLIGRAKGIPLPILFVGSYYAAGFPTSGEALSNELTDWKYIVKGYYACP